jgi:hypothetical protein
MSLHADGERTVAARESHRVGPGESGMGQVRRHHRRADRFDRLPASESLRDGFVSFRPPRAVCAPVERSGTSRNPASDAAQLAASSALRLPVRRLRQSFSIATFQAFEARR